MAISVAKFRARQAGILPRIELSPMARRKNKRELPTAEQLKTVSIESEPLDIGSRISKLVQSDQGIEFKGDDFRSICEPGVYLFLLNNQPLYVGMSDNVVNRASSNLHHMVRAKHEATSVKLWPCMNHASALEVEKILIETLQPLYNKRSRHGQTCKRLGYATSRALVTQYGVSIEGPRKEKRTADAFYSQVSRILKLRRKENVSKLKIIATSD